MRNGMSVVVASVVVLGLSGCGLANTRYVRTNYTIGEAKEAMIGSPMVSVESGVKNEVYDNVLSSMSQELIYGGVAGNTIKVTYREYGNNMARPAFSQELQYDL